MSVDTLAISYTPGADLEVYSGIARLSRTLWARRHRATPEQLDVAVLIVHPTSNFLGHYALAPLAARGVDAIGLTTRYLGNDTTLTMENCVLDIGAAITHLKELGYRKVVLVGNSGGGGLASLYQSQAENPTITSTPAGDPADLVAAELPPADALVLAMAHPGRATVFTEFLDPAIRDEADPFDRDPELDLFAPANRPPFTGEFVARYRAAQIARNRKITAWVRIRLERLATDPHLAGPGGERLRDLPFVVHGTAADPRFFDLSLEPSDRDGTTLWGTPWQANFGPATLGHMTSLRAWLSQWSYDESRANGPRELPYVTVPVQVIYGTADTAAHESHARSMFDAVSHDVKELIAIRGADHYFRGQPELAAQMCDHLVTWLHQVL